MHKNGVTCASTPYVNIHTQKIEGISLKYTAVFDLHSLGYIIVIFMPHICGFGRENV